MPRRDDHINQSRHNADFYATIDKTRFRDWAITALFYIGLHLIDAVLAEKRNVHPSKHSARSDEVANTPELRPVYSDYEFLKNASFYSSVCERS